MKRKDYQEPTMKVVQLRHRTKLMSGSPNDTVSPTSVIDDWQDGGTTNDEIIM